MPNPDPRPDTTAQRQGPATAETALPPDRLPPPAPDLSHPAVPDREPETPVQESRAHNVPPYKAEELSLRIGDGSVDVNRLAATVGAVQQTVNALAHWVNQQIQQGSAKPTVPTGPGSDAKTGTGRTGKRGE